MNTHTFEKLQYNRLKEIVKDYCTSSLGRQLLEKLMPSGNKAVVENRLNETSEARRLLDYSGSVPLQGIMNISEIIEKVEKDIILDSQSLTSVAAFLRGCRKIKGYMGDKIFYAPVLQSYSFGIEELKVLEEEIEGAIRNNKVDDAASGELKKIRRHIVLAEGQIEERLNTFLKNSQNKPYIQEFFISKRQGRLTVPIKAAYKNRVDGTVIEATPKTVFIEPSNVNKVVTELLRFKVEEEIEEYKVLSYLTGMVYDKLLAIRRNIEIMGQYDMTFAKGKYSKAIQGIQPQINDYGKISIIDGKHPLLTGKVVPLNLNMGEDFRTLIITGPNAGGKTIVLKTVGLLTLALQSGFHIEAKEGTNMSVFDRVFADIGDNQSLENSLSTFSSHVKNLASIIKETHKKTLLLFDEIGSGTEPNEGAALAIAILEGVYHKGAITIATTHYNEIKNFSSQHPDFENAAMQFKKETLEPLFKLMVGKAGNSNALWISQRMGVEPGIILKAQQYMDHKAYLFECVSSKNIRARKVEEDIEIEKQCSLDKGDKVFLSEYQDYGIIYKPKDDFNNLEILYKGKFLKINHKQVKLAVKAGELYPSDYDLDSLFTSFKERKLEKDIKRGSKKALKKIRKHGIENLK